MSYQPFPDLDEADYERLKEDIRRRGIQVPIVIDENGEVLDGHQRSRVAEDLGLSVDEVPVVRLTGLSEAEKWLHVYALNTFRRHASTAKKRKWVSEYVQTTLQTGYPPVPTWFESDGKVEQIRTPASSKEHARERQHFHRFIERVRPSEPLSESEYHPLQLGNDILLLLDAIKPSIKNAAALAKLEQAQLFVQQLAWGPEDG